jgi:hypothetical protein
LKFLIPKNMQENLREYSKKTLSTLKNAAYPLIPIFLLLFAAIIARTQEEPFQVGDFPVNNEESATEPGQDLDAVQESAREIPEWVKPARWFRSNSGGMPLEEMKSRIAAMRGDYALVIDFTNSDELPVFLRDYYDENFFIEVRTLYKEGKEDRTQWIFRDGNYGVRLIAVLFEAKHEEEDENIEAAFFDEDAVVIQNTDDENIIAEAEDDIDGEKTNTEVKEKKERKHGLASGFVEIYNEEYHLTTEYRYSDKGDEFKIEYFYNEKIKVSAQTMLWDDDKEDYIRAYTDYYRYNRSAFLRAVERVFLTDQHITSADNVIKSDGAAGDTVTNNDPENNVVKVSFPHNILAAARNDFFMGEKFNAYPDFFGDIFVLKGSRLIYTTDKNGKVLEQTLVNEDDEQTVVWKIVNTWSNDRIVKITKTEGDTVLLAEYEYNGKGDRVLERNIKDGVLERVVRSDGKTDIEELYQDDKVVLKAVWEDGRKISESRVTKN